MNQKYVFDSILDLAKHLLSIDENIRPLKLQKSLYFLFAFYITSYGKLYIEDSETAQDGIIEGTDEKPYPEYLFPEDFEAWKFGPVNRKVYSEFKAKNIQPKKWVPDTPMEEEIHSFINEAFEAIKQKSDFSLVMRSQEDQAWIKKVDADNNIMDKELIKNEYSQKQL